MAIYLNALAKGSYYSEKSGRNYIQDHGLIYFTLKLTYSISRIIDVYDIEYTKTIIREYKNAGWTENHTGDELLELFNLIDEKREFIKKDDYSNKTHIWNA